MDPFNASILTPVIDGTESYPGMESAIAFISKWARIVCIAMGIPGNVVAFLVTIRKDNRHLSACVFMASLAIVDNIVLHQRMLYGILIALNEEFLLNKTFLGYCWYSGRFGAIASGLLLAAMTVDRAICVAFPMRAVDLCTASKARKIAMVIILSQALIFLNVFFTYDILAPGHLVRSVPTAPWVGALFDIYELVMGAILPFSLIAIGNAAIIISVRRAANRRAEMSKTDMTSQKSRLQERSITRMLLFVSFAFLICQFPYRVSGILFEIPGVMTMYDMNSHYWKTRSLLQKIVFTELFMASFAVNFYLYFLGGGEKFRQDSKQLLLVCFKRRRATNQRT
ncbi:thyrotropin-releasing hormone receptor-like [Lineus longissimus]|uniref:thyrotropin-releasing hormone receptor-like n=1 Tax=Lineus longissimus TaxID=88925 RepID=UPI00315CC9D2